jgi:AraC-like DNA-binding protein
VSFRVVDRVRHLWQLWVVVASAPPPAELPRAFAPGGLEGTVRTFWSVGAGVDGPRRALPDGCTDLIFHLHEIHGVPTVAVLGPMSRPFEIPAERAARLGASLAPGAALPILGVPLCELTDRVVDLRRLWGAEADALLDRLREQPDEAERIAAVSALLERRRRRLEPDGNARLAKRAVACIRDGSVATVEDIAAAVGGSVRQLERVFREQVGLTPKQLLRIARLHRLLRRSARGEALPWAQLALELGFTDQAHLVHEFRALAGEAPVAFQRSQLLTGFYNLHLE